MKIPFADLRPFNPKAVLRDVFAGLTLASVNVPQVLGYARIAGAVLGRSGSVCERRMVRCALALTFCRPGGPGLVAQLSSRKYRYSRSSPLRGRRLVKPSFVRILATLISIGCV
jgi:hypothetical protein